MKVILHTMSMLVLASEVSPTVLELLLQLVPSGLPVGRAHGLLGRRFRVIELLQQLGVDYHTLVEQQPNGEGLMWGVGLKIVVLNFQEPTDHLLVESFLLDIGIVNTCSLRKEGSIFPAAFP